MTAELSVDERHCLMANKFIELANRMLGCGAERDLVSSAILAAAARFAVFNATEAYQGLLEEWHIRRIQEQLAVFCMRERAHGLAERDECWRVRPRRLSGAECDGPASLSATAIR
jgi:hypothetical protein